MSKRHAHTHRDRGEATGHPRGGKRVSSVTLVPQPRDALAILVSGLLLALLVLSGVAQGEPRVAQPTEAAGDAAAPYGRCDLDAPCATDIAIAARATTDERPGVDARIANVLCDLNSPCTPDLIAAWNRLCDLNTPCLPGQAASGSAPGQQRVIQLDLDADADATARSAPPAETFDWEQYERTQTR